MGILECLLLPLILLSRQSSHLNQVLAALHKRIHLSKYAGLVQDPAPTGEPVLGKNGPTQKARTLGANLPIQCYYTLVPLIQGEP